MMKKENLLFFVLISVVWISCGSVTNKNNFYDYTIQHELYNAKTAVASAHPLASQAGAWAIDQGGNAYDAAVATQLALAVVFPAAGNLGGGGFWVSREKNGTSRMLDFRERAPLSSRENMFMVGDSVSLAKKFGWLSAGVPGTIDGIFQTLPYCKLELEKLFEPAIALAKYGFAITENMANGLNEIQQDLRKYNPNNACPFIKDNWKKGDTLRQEKLAMTLQRISKKGKDEFYQGETAEMILKQSSEQGGIYTADDFKKYKSVWRDPIHFKYGEYMMIVPPLPSSGGILLKQFFGMLETVKEKVDFSKQSLQTVQAMTEIEKRAFYDRTKYMGDPDFYHAPSKKMMDDKYIRNKISNFYAGQKAIPSLWLQFPEIAMKKESEETTHISIVDKEGNAISITTTLNGWYGSMVFISEAGFFLNNQMDDFSAKPGTANMYGAIEGMPNKIEPEKRMLSSMTPTIVLKNNQLKFVVGSPGGTTIPTSVFQTLVNLIEYKLPPKESVFNPRFHHQYLPDQIFVEKDFSQEYTNPLTKLSYSVVSRENIGRVDLVVVEDNGTLTAIGDKRGDNSPDGEK